MYLMYRTITYNVEEVYVLFTECISEFGMPLGINNDYFYKQHQLRILLERQIVYTARYKQSSA